MLSFLFILLAFLTVGQALQHGTADNDTIVLTKRTNLTLEDIFGCPETAPFTRNLDKRMLRKLFRSQRPEENPAHLHRPDVTVALVDDRFVPVSVHGTQYNFQIDTASVCSLISSAPPSQQERFDSVHCPRNPGGVSSLSGDVYWQQIAIGEVSWQGLLISNTFTWHGSILGLSLSDSTVREGLGVVSQFIQKKFKHPIFALRLSQQHGSKLDIGGVDQSVKMEYHKVVKTRGQQQWLIGSCTVYVDDQVIVSNIRTVFASAVGPVHGPSWCVRKIEEKTNGNPHAAVYFKWGNGEKFPLAQVIYSLFAKFIQKLRFSRRSRTTLMGLENHSGLWVLGADFMDGKSVAFNADPNGPEVGIGMEPLPQYTPHEPLPPYSGPENPALPQHAPNH